MIGAPTYKVFTTKGPGVAATTCVYLTARTKVRDKSPQVILNQFGSQSRDYPAACKNLLTDPIIRIAKPAALAGCWVL